MLDTGRESITCSGSSAEIVNATVRREPSVAADRYLVRSSTSAAFDQNDALPVSPFTDRWVFTNDKPADQSGYIFLFDELKLYLTR